jgi:hypothetical protein
MVRQRSNRRGAEAGILAGSTVVVWFLVLDLVAGFPLRTPAFLAAITFGLDEPGLAVLPLFGYTLLHYGIFIGLGLLIARLSRALHPRAHLPLGIVAGFFLFDLVFYGSLVISGVDVTEALGWPVVLFGNLLAGVVLLEYLRLTGPRPAPGWRALLRGHRILRQGLSAGLLGAGAVALSFLVIDFIFREILFTPAVLGSALLHGAAGPGEVRFDGATILGYSTLHVLAFVGVGLSAAALVQRAEDHPALILAIALLFITFEVLFLGLVAIVAVWTLDTIGWWNILIGNAAATIVMAVYLARAHPSLLRLLRREPLATPR